MFENNSLRYRRIVGADLQMSLDGEEIIRRTYKTLWFNRLAYILDAVNQLIILPDVGTQYV